MALDFSKPDAAEEDTRNRILWLAARGGKRNIRRRIRERLSALKLRLAAK